MIDSKVRFGTGLPGTLLPRDLLATILLAVGVLVGATACNPDSTPKPAAEETSYAFELEEATITELQAGMESGRWTSKAIVESYLARIAAIDRDGPELRSIIALDPDAAKVADALDRERAESGPRGPLHGIPILLKDNIESKGLPTTAGSIALAGSVPEDDSFVARRLREAGAVILGKANLSEWANFRSSGSSSGWSAVGGQVKNPYALDRNPCGSSSGSGAATAANLAAAALGTETNGSIVCPSSANGIVGVKPTIGLVSRSRIVPIAHTQDTAGPMARTVRDAAIVLGALVGVDPDDPATAASEGRAHADYVQFLDEGSLSGARIGVAREYFGFDREVDQLMEAAIEAMRAAGAEIVDSVEIPNRREMRGPSFQVLLYEFKADLDAYLDSLGADSPVRSLADVIAFNDEHADKEMPYFGQELMIQAQEKGPLTEPEYLEAVEAAPRLAGPEGIDAVMDEHDLDAIIAPTGGPAWTTDLINGDHFGGGSSSPAAISGYPNITVPAGFVFGMPVGISFFGRAWSEPELLGIAYAFEQATKHRRGPEFLPTADLRVASKPN